MWEKGFVYHYGQHDYGLCQGPFWIHGLGAIAIWGVGYD
jgi:hypothetical protein